MCKISLVHINHLLINFKPEDEKDKDWDAYKNYIPEKVMEIFKEVFLD